MITRDRDLALHIVVGSQALPYYETSPVGAALLDYVITAQRDRDVVHRQ
jgi:hypothetical protein